MSVQSTFQGEVQLAGWRESHNSGAVVSFWLPDPSELEVFRGLTAKKGNTAGHRFMAVLVEIGDDEQPLASNISAGSSEHIPDDEKKKGGALSKLAGMWCRDSEFQKWANEYAQKAWPGTGWEVSTPEEAASFIRRVCGVDSRVELDYFKESAEAFQELIRLPYMAWLQEKR